jgi:hypothetical protein
VAWHREHQVQERVAAAQSFIDDAVYDLIGIGTDDRRHFAEEIAFRQCLPSMDENEDSDDEEDYGDEPQTDLLGSV